MLRVVTYNIQDGGTPRVELLATTLAALRPDVVGLVEAEDHAVVRRLAQRLGLHALIAEGNVRAGRRRHDAAILTRQPARTMINIAACCPAVEKAALAALVPLGPAGRLVRLVVAHLHAHIGVDDEAQRLRELTALLDWLDAEPNAAGPALPTLLMGDFNANAPYHRIDPAKLRPNERALLAQQDGRVPYDVVQCLLDRGYVDCYHVRWPQRSDASFTTQHAAQRVDYVWLRQPPSAGPGAWAVADAGVAQASPAAAASDHYPLWTRFIWQDN